MPGVSDRGSLFYLQQHFAVLNLHGKGSYAACRRLQDGISGGDVKPALMKGALDFVAFKEPLAKPGISVGADVRGRVDASLDAVESDLVTVDGDRDDVALGYIVLLRYWKPLFSHLKISEMPRMAQAGWRQVDGVRSDR
jgi:hypothetical protein